MEGKFETKYFYLERMFMGLFQNCEFFYCMDGLILEATWDKQSNVSAGYKNN
jgi:hypothetical protein